MAQTKGKAMTIKDNLAALIGQRHLNPTMLAKETGITQPTLHRILSGESLSPRVEHLKTLAAFFGVGVEDLIGGEMPVASATPTLNAKAERIAQHLSSLPDEKLDALALILGIKL